MVRARRARARDRARASPSPRGRRTAEQAGRDACSSPARPAPRCATTPPRLVMFAITSVARLDGARRVGVGHVERHEAAETGIPNDADCRVATEALGDRGGGQALAHDPTSSVSSPRRSSHAVSAAVRGRCASGTRRAGVFGVLAHDRAEERVVVAGEVLRRRVHRDVASELERPHAGRGGRRVAHDTGGVRGRRLEVRHRQERVRRRLEPDEIDAVGRCPGLVVLDLRRPSAAARRAARRFRSTRFASATTRPGERSASTTDVHAAAPEEKSSASPRSSSPRRRSASARRTAEARIGEAPGLAVLVRPGRRPVDRRRSHANEAITGRATLGSCR